MPSPRTLLALLLPLLLVSATKQPSYDPATEIQPPTDSDSLPPWEPLPPTEIEPDQPSAQRPPTEIQPMPFRGKSGAGGSSGEGAAAGGKYIPYHLPPMTTSSSSTSSEPISCPTTLTYYDPVNCNGCTVTSYGLTSTDLVDCGGCAELVTSTTEYPFQGLCPVCRNGGGALPTTYLPDNATTVTSCEPTPTG